MNILLKQTQVPLMFLIVGMLLFTVTPMMPFTVPASRTFTGLLMCLILFGLSVWLIKRDGLQLSDVNLRPDNHTPARLALGFGVGAVIVGLMFIALFNLTSLDYEKVVGQSPMPFILSSLVIIPLALMEELVFRGYPFFRLLTRIHVRYVILITSILFGLSHLNDQNPLFTVLMGPGVWGLVYGVAAYISQSLAVPLGLHVAANFMQGIFGMKSYVDSLWMIQVSEADVALMEVETLGIFMQIMLLVGAVITLEAYIRFKR